MPSLSAQVTIKYIYAVIHSLKIASLVLLSFMLAEYQLKYVL